MKTLILTLSLVVLTSLSYSQETASTEINKMHMKTADLEIALLQGATDQFTLMMAKEPGAPVKIKVYEDNKLLYTRRVKKAGTANIKYDLSQFPDGEYTFKVEKDKKVVYSVKIRKGINTLADSN